MQINNNFRDMFNLQFVNVVNYKLFTLFIHFYLHRRITFN